MPGKALDSAKFYSFSLRIHALSTCINAVFRSGQSAFFIQKSKMVVQIR